MQNFRNLSVWEKAHHFTLQVYQITERFPRTEMFGLTSQLRRASSSIAINLAEGCGRTQLEFARSYRLRSGRRARWSTTSCSLMIWVLSVITATSDSSPAW